jgi:hypothetical protein
MNLLLQLSCLWRNLRFVLGPRSLLIAADRVDSDHCSPVLSREPSPYCPRSHAARSILWLAGTEESLSEVFSDLDKNAPDGGDSKYPPATRLSERMPRPRSLLLQAASACRGLKNAIGVGEPVLPKNQAENALRVEYELRAFSASLEDAWKYRAIPYEEHEAEGTPGYALQQGYIFPDMQLAGHWTGLWCAQMANSTFYPSV